MATTTIDTGRRVFSNLSALIFTPWTDEDTIGTEGYDLVNIVGDTTSVEQDDNDVTEIESEFEDVPLYENVKLGKKTFSCECIDFQNKVLKSLFGWETDDSGNALAPNKYKSLYCKVEMHFNSTEDIVVLPKVKLNSKAALASMKTDASRGTITGTCYTAYVTSGTTKGWTDMAAVASANISTYTVASSDDSGS